MPGSTKAESIIASIVSHQKDSRLLATGLFMRKAKINVDILAIIVVGLLAFGLQIPTLGFFQDDWNFVFHSSARGVQGLFDFLLVDGRPGATWVYTFGFALLGYEPALWQSFSLLLRVWTAINVWMILQALWPGKRYVNLMASILFLTYPFFTLQPLSVAYAPHFAAYFFFSLSILLMISAVEKPKNYLVFTAGAVLSTFIHLFTVEYFIGLELLRPFVIWIVLSAREKTTRRDTLQKVLIAWFPYLLALVVFVYWRSFILPGMGARNDPLAAISNAGNIIRALAQNFIADLVLMLVGSWFNLVDPRLYIVGPIRNLYFWAISLVAGIFFYFISRTTNHQADERRDPVKLALAGILIVTTGMVSTYGAGYIVHEKIAPWNSRFALSSLLGLALLILALTETLITSNRARHAFFAVLVGLIIGFHNLNTLDFKATWDHQSRLYQQLMWRAPSIKPGTAIVAYEEILGYMGDYPTALAVNTMYGAKQVESIPYWFFAIVENFKSSASAVTGDQPILGGRAPITFRAESGDVLSIWYEPDNGQCLWVLRPEDSEYKLFPVELQKAAQVSRLQNISPTQTEHSLYDIIVREDRNTWCYYYQKADLARQLGDWNAVTEYWNEAQSKEYGPASGFEYIVFIEGFAHLEQWDQAVLLTNQARKITKGMYLILCPTWQRLAQETPVSNGKDAQVNEAYELLKCVP